MLSRRTDLLVKASATGSFLEWRGGMALWIAYGTWNGATASLDLKADNDAGIALQCLDRFGNACTLAANGMKLIVLPAGLYRVSFTGTPTSIWSYLTSAIKEAR